MVILMKLCLDVASPMLDPTSKLSFGLVVGMLFNDILRFIFFKWIKLEWKLSLD